LLNPIKDNKIAPQKNCLVATEEAQLTLAVEGQTHTVRLYSPEGLELLASLWIKLAAQYRLMYEPTWLGIPIIQLPADIVMMQELIWNIRPDVIVECGLAHGGSAVLYASICELLGKGQVLGIDVEVRPANRAAIESHPLSKRIEIIEGSSIDQATIDLVRDRIQGAQTVLVILDSNHTHHHVYQELTMYHPLVTPGSYLVTMDGAQAYVWDIPRGKKQWREDNPLQAIRQFIQEHPEFEVDPYYTRMHLTSSPEGFLRRLTPEELKNK
jgi:cephalosporin hydroxylase